MKTSNVITVTCHMVPKLEETSYNLGSDDRGCCLSWDRFYYKFFVGILNSHVTCFLSAYMHLCNLCNWLQFIILVGNNVI